ncbi:MAG: SigE family RNA polymerase sigma factor [Acidothermaceae bacterium]
MSFEEFTRTCLPPLLRFAKVLCGSRELAEDVVQEVLVRAYGRWDRIVSLDKPDAYVRRMIVNEFLSWRRKCGRVVPRAEVSGTDVSPDPSGGYVERAALASELRNLPRKQQTVIVLRFYCGLSDAEIADELGCTTGTVRSHASRALATLRVQMCPIPSLSSKGI